MGEIQSKVALEPDAGGRKEHEKSPVWFQDAVNFPHGRFDFRPRHVLENLVGDDKIEVAVGKRDVALLNAPNEIVLAWIGPRSWIGIGSPEVISLRPGLADEGADAAARIENAAGFRPCGHFRRLQHIVMIWRRFVLHGTPGATHSMT